MNIYLGTIITLLIAEFLFGLIADLLNLRALKNELPEEFHGVFDEETYKKSQDYTSVKTKFGILASSVGLCALIIFWVAGGFNAVDGFVRSFELHPLITGTLYIGILFFLQNILSLPFKIYSTFVIEERFGFNRTTAKTFAVDMLKGLMLTALIGVPVLLAVQSFFMYGGSYAWLSAWGAVSAFMLGLYFIAPNVIFPLFNKFTPLEDGELKEKIFELARKLSFPLSGIYVIDGSRRSAKANAFFVGFGKNKRIALFDTLIAD
ncbi:MAG: M48 family metallopeptidase, partial [Candidatus Sungbacteria bacterium]|nr:M48 family metallopeptidase [Candidatus Sungbacteria bacterium]